MPVARPLVANRDPQSVDRLLALVVVAACGRSERRAESLGAEDSLIFEPLLNVCVVCKPQPLPRSEGASLQGKDLPFEGKLRFVKGSTFP